MRPADLLWLAAAWRAARKALGRVEIISQSEAASEEVSKVELAKVELEAHTALYNQALEGLKTAPTRVAPVVTFSSAIIGFIATSLVKEFGPRIAKDPHLARAFVWGLWAVGGLTLASIALAGYTLTGVASVVYVPRGTTLKRLLGAQPRVGAYFEEGVDYVKEVLDTTDFDAASAVVMYSASLKQTQAISLLRAVRNTRRLIGWALVCLGLSLAITMFGFFYCVANISLRPPPPTPQKAPTPSVRVDFFRLGPDR